MLQKATQDFKLLNDIRDKSGCTILMLLARGESRTNLVKLIKSRIDEENKKVTKKLDLLNKELKIIQQLMFSMNFEDSEIIFKQIIDNNMCDINLQDDNGNTALVHACINNNDKFIKLLLNNKLCDVNIRTIDNSTAIMYCNNKDRLELLLEHKLCDINLQDDSGNTALMKACFNGNTNIVKTLLQYKKYECNTNIQNHYGRTAIMIAFEMLGDRSDRSDIINILMKFSKYNYNLQDKRGITFLMQILSEPSMINSLILKRIIQKSINLTSDLDQQDVHGMTTLMYAVQTRKSKKKSTIEKIINKHQNYNIQDNEGKTSLIHSVEYNKSAITNLLIKKDCNINIKDTTNKTAFWYSLRKETLVMANMFINLYILRKDVSFLEYVDDIKNLLNSGNGMLKDKMKRTFKKKIINLYETEFKQILDIQDNIFTKCYNNLGDFNTVKIMIEYLI
ncbi:MAG: hypothetical protein Edafosvirus45_4 [Edafosvirus sp.]|uniref:Uncharacterized protein n=1 Tax=Edafosvirus sp. TaxID=2487765 RepID=A0A3G4ZVI0_9VIRU|nr:MAG: hypothetical protein Edafosvirus45_4 [Edafosvirus sp.]